MSDVKIYPFSRIVTFPCRNNIYVYQKRNIINGQYKRHDTLGLAEIELLTMGIKNPEIIER